MTTDIYTTTIERALSATSDSQMRSILVQRTQALSLRDIRRLSAHLATMPQQRKQVKLAVLHTYTSVLLDPYWKFESLLNSLDAHIYTGPYGAILSEAQSGSDLVAYDPDVTYVLLRWEDLDPSFSRLLMQMSAEERKALLSSVATSLDRLAGALRSAVNGLIVFALLPPFYSPELGNIDDSLPMEASEWGLRAQLKDAGLRSLSNYPSTHFFDITQLQNELGRVNLFDMRLWESSQFPYSVWGAQSLVKALIAYPVLLKAPKLKSIVVDADNTLWGGIIGEDGLHGIKLGPTYPGSAYVAFQRRLLALYERGFVLALCSKNNPEDVRSVLEGHPHQLLKPQHFASVRVNWDPKPDNIRSIATELNLGLDALLYIDDSPHEVYAVQSALPEVTVLQVPTNTVELPYILDQVPGLQILTLTNEDRARTELYQQERSRQNHAGSFSDMESYLSSLEMVMKVGTDDTRVIGRIAQLTQKTNQFNLTTHRYTEAQISGFMADPDWLVAYFSLSDRFGDSGLVGIALVNGLTKDKASIDTFLMSCRVIGRRAELGFIRFILSYLEKVGIRHVLASYIPTAKNSQVRDFWESAGFRLIHGETEGVRSYEWSEGSVLSSIKIPIRIEKSDLAI